MSDLFSTINIRQTQATTWNGLKSDSHIPQYFKCYFDFLIKVFDVKYLQSQNMLIKSQSPNLKWVVRWKTHETGMCTTDNGTSLTAFNTVCYLIGVVN